MEINEQVFLEKLKKKIIKDTINILYEKKEKLANLSKQDFIDLIIKPKITIRCLGIRNSSSGFVQCNNNSSNNTNYCKRHFKPEQKKEINLDNTINLIENTTTTCSNLNFTTTFINNTLYKINETYIYDFETLEKVGYIEKENFILTNDPFILDSNLTF